MILDIYKEARRGEKLRISERLERDPSITYQQFTLYYMLRFHLSTAKEGDTFDPEEYFSEMREDDWINETYPQTAGGKVHRMEVTVPWDHVFDE